MLSTIAAELRTVSVNLYLLWAEQAYVEADSNDRKKIRRKTQPCEDSGGVAAIRSAR